MSNAALWMTSASLADEPRNSSATSANSGLSFRKCRRQPVHRLGFGRHVALGIDEAMELAPRRDAVEELDAADLDQPVAALRIEAGGFGVEHDLAHADRTSANSGRRIKPSGAA